jgi:hypothetical protein
MAAVTSHRGQDVDPPLVVAAKVPTLVRLEGSC